MNAGKLRHRVRILQPVDTTTDKADTVITYDESTYRYIQCSIEPLQGRELLFAQQIRADMSHKITMRYTSGLTHRTLLRWVDKDGTERNFNCGSFVDKDMRNVEMSVYAYEIR